jgi:putative IMPACT (imprinted ancient) family translation regulator
MRPTLKIADSEFIGFVKPISCKDDAISYFNSLKKEYPSAAHIPFGWIVTSENELENDAGFEEDGEPPGSVGPVLFQELRNFTSKIVHEEEQQGGARSYVLIVVRHFGHRLLGVTCGRLKQCYQSIAVLTLHRHFNNDAALHQDFTKEPLTSSKYGLGAGDCEIIHNIIQDVDQDADTGADADTDNAGENPNKADPNININIWAHRIMTELEFGGFRGHQKEELPRLQNLQADISSGLVPVYRYPGNYRGDEWETYQWCPLSFKIKHAVEKNLRPLVEQEMNHCVTNYYRNGNDFIDHHSDKILDLDKEGVIISVSLGDERILELKRRAAPHDTTQIVLPHGSMLVLGPYTNQLFTHSILRKKGSTQPRISLTFRRVLTFLDANTGRLFGEGVSTSSLSEIRKCTRADDVSFLVGVGAVAVASAFFHVSNKSTCTRNRQNLNIKAGAITTGLLGLSYLSFKRARLIFCKRREENEARAFFSRASVHGTKY